MCPSLIGLPEAGLSHAAAAAAGEPGEAAVVVAGALVESVAADDDDAPAGDVDADGADEVVAVVDVSLVHPEATSSAVAPSSVRRQRERSGTEWIAIKTSPSVDVMTIS
jgi:hypothetical protein